MKNIKFYLCDKCGNVLWATGEVEVTCCGEKLNPLEVQGEDFQHKFKVEEIENDYYVTLDHEMRKCHHFTFGALVTYDRMAFVRLYPEQEAAFRVPRLGRGNLYVCCNNHGLYKKKLR